jgi:hypothetical protein
MRLKYLDHSGMTSADREIMQSEAGIPFQFLVRSEPHWLLLAKAESVTSIQQTAPDISSGSGGVGSSDSSGQSWSVFPRKTWREMGLFVRKSVHGRPSDERQSRQFDTVLALLLH